ncbi:MAG: redoxin domain-containing protein [Halanaerobiales bacterium]|nr:redoxin domain-containing protein [Halanaerobiales bacterium]
MLKIGTPVPDFTAISTRGMVCLKDYIRSQNVIVYFSPKEFSTQSIAYLREVQNFLEEFKRMDTVVLGVNQEQIENLRKLAERECYNFPLVSDPEFRFGKIFDVNLAETEENIPTMFLIDMDGVVYYAKEGNIDIKYLLRKIEQAS